jgi:hypothetical protein
MGSRPRPEFICKAFHVSRHHADLTDGYSGTYSEDGVHFLIVRNEPSDEGECAQAGPDEVGEPEDDESKDGEVRKEPVSGQHPAICRCTILWLMQSTEEDCGSEGRRPDECAGIYQPPPCKASESKPAHSVSRVAREGVE